MGLRRTWPLAALALLAVPGAASADTTWTQITDETVQPVTGRPLELTFDGTNVTGFWTVRPQQDDVQVVRFAPSRAADAAGLTRAVPPSLAGWDNVEVEPLPAPGGGQQLLVTGSFAISSAPPTGTSLAPVDAGGAVGALAPPLTPQAHGTLSAVLLPSGEALWVATYQSGLVLYRNGVAIAAVTGPPPGLVNGNGYIPELAYDRGGRLWLAFYAFGSSIEAGVYVAQLDPATGVPITPASLAPASGAVDNNGYAIALACHDTCRVIYQETAATTLSNERIVSWTPGEAAPTLVASAPANVRRTSVVAAYRADGRLWVAWDETLYTAPGPTYVASLGDARGAGGRVVPAGGPPRGDYTAANGLAALAVGDDLLLVANWRRSDPQRTAQWANLVLAPGAVDTGDVPDPKIVTSPGGKLVYPGTVTGRCVRVRPVADKPARIWAQVFSGRRNGSPVSNRVRFRFTAPGAKSKCVTLQAKPKGFYTGKVYRIKFEVRTGANAKPIEATRPPWRTQPQIKITL